MPALCLYSSPIGIILYSRLSISQMHSYDPWFPFPALVILSMPIVQFYSRKSLGSIFFSVYPGYFRGNKSRACSTLLFIPSNYLKLVQVYFLFWLPIERENRTRSGGLIFQDHESPPHPMISQASASRSESRRPEFLRSESVDLRAWKRERYHWTSIRTRKFLYTRTPSRRQA